MATNNKRKKAVAATVAAAALLLGGTFAWTSISQQALNESAGIVNVGGRLHDDFDGKNKDVYVENFTDPLNGGQPIYARVRLDEYMEVGQEAGSDTDLDGDGLEATPVLDGTSRGDVTSWQTHVPQTDCERCELEGTCVIHDHWTWTMGGETTYMPTFNKDKDSLESDVNGTYHGTDRDQDTHDKVYYDDYVVYGAGGAEGVDFDEKESVEGTVTSVVGTAYYDNDTDTDEESPIVQAGNEDENHKAVEEKHVVKDTASAEVVLMADWNGTAGNYWVYDEDGWAYWANPIMPGQATGLLLDGIEMTKNPGEKCYYGINVVAEFATIGDWEYFNDGAGLAEGSNALRVMETAAAAVPTITVTNVDGVTTVQPGDKVQFSASVTVGDVSGQSEDQFTWSVVNKDGSVSETSSVDDTGILTVGSSEASEELYVLAEYNEMPGAVGVAGVIVEIPIPPEIAAIGDTTAGSAETITIDNKEWYVVSKESGKGLLMAAEPVYMAFDTDSKVFEGSDLDLYLNGEYLDNLTNIKDYAETTAVKTTANVWGEADTISDHKVFILSFDDFNNSAYGREDRRDQSISHFVSDEITSALFATVGTDELATRTHYGDEWYENSGGSATTETMAKRLTYYESGGRYRSYIADRETSFFPVVWVRYGEGIGITNETPDVYAEQGNVISFSAVKSTVTGETVQNPDVTWSISGNNTGEGGTTIDANGNVTIGNEEHGTVITVTAAATGDGSISDTFALTVIVPELKVKTYDDRYYFNKGEGIYLDISVTEGSSIENAELEYSVEGDNGKSTVGEDGWFIVSNEVTSGTVLTLTASTKDGKYSDSVEIEVGIPTVQIIEKGYLAENQMNQWSELHPAEFQVRIVRDDELIELPYTYELDNDAYGTYIDEDSSREYAIRVITPEQVSEDGEWYTFSVTLDKDPNVRGSFTWGLQEIYNKDDI